MPGRRCHRMALPCAAHHSRPLASNARQWAAYVAVGAVLAQAHASLQQGQVLLRSLVLMVRLLLHCGCVGGVMCGSVACLCVVYVPRYCVRVHHNTIIDASISPQGVAVHLLSRPVAFSL
jgi:hypothetical protein